jgi:hypothetical protein
MVGHDGSFKEFSVHLQVSVLQSYVKKFKDQVRRKVVSMRPDPSIREVGGACIFNSCHYIWMKNDFRDNAGLSGLPGKERQFHCCILFSENKPTTKYLTL